MNRPAGGEQPAEIRTAHRFGMRVGMVNGAALGALGTTTILLITTGRWAWAILSGLATCLPLLVAFFVALPDDY